MKELFDVISAKTQAHAIALFLLVAFPFMALWLYLMYRDNYSVLNGVRHAWWLMGSGVGLSFGTYYVMAVTRSIETGR